MAQLNLLIKYSLLKLKEFLEDIQDKRKLRKQPEDLADKGIKTKKPATPKKLHSKPNRDEIASSKNYKIRTKPEENVQKNERK